MGDRHGGRFGSLGSAQGARGHRADAIFCAAEHLPFLDKASGIRKWSGPVAK